MITILIIKNEPLSLYIISSVTVQPLCHLFVWDYMKRIFCLFCTFLILSIAISSAFAKSQSTESNVKKIVMMLDIVVKEYEEGVSEGKIVNDAEYEESRLFLEQAQERFGRASESLGESAKPIKQKLIRIAEKIKSKADPAQVQIDVEKIQTKILTLFGVKIEYAPKEPVSLDEGKSIYESNCKICHGLAGKGDGPIASQLNPSPAILADPAITGDAETIAYDNYKIINVGIAGTGMTAWSEVLSETDIWNVSYYIRTFSNENVKLPSIPADAASSEKKFLAILSEVENILDRSLESFKNSQIQDAGELASDSYLVFEKVEPTLVNERKDLALRLESAFGRYQGEIKQKAPLHQVQGIYQNIKNDLKLAREALNKNVGYAGLFIQSLSIIVREGFEAILVIAALITFLVKSRNEEKTKSIWIGMGLGVFASLITAYILHEILKLSSESQEVIEGWIMLFSVAVLFWVSYWLISKIQTHRWQNYITGKLQEVVSTGSAYTLGLVSFLSVYREGFETVLFYKALYTYSGAQTSGILPGFFVGCVILIGVFYAINKLGLRIPVKWFFSITGVFLYYMAFTFMGKGLHELQMGQLLVMTPVSWAPEIHWLGMYPTLETFVGQFILVAAYVAALIYTFGIKSPIKTNKIKNETRNLFSDISAVHDLVNHISNHTKRCSLFLKDTEDHDLKELALHLGEIHDKLHELSDHVRYVESQLTDEYDHLDRVISQDPAQEAKELP